MTDTQPKPGVCTWCGQTMTADHPCTVTVWDDYPDGITRARIPWGSEHGTEHVDYPCPDCGVRPGGVHHPACDCEECPRCHQQQLGCDCPSTHDEDDDEDTRP